MKKIKAMRFISLVLWRMGGHQPCFSALSDFAVQSLHTQLGHERGFPAREAGEH